MTINLSKVADTYVRHYRFREEEDFWAWEVVQQQIETGLSQGWQATRALIEKADDDEFLAYIAAGPVEDLLDCYSHAAFDLVEQAAKGDDRFARAIALAFFDEDHELRERWVRMRRSCGFENEMQ